MPPGREDRPIGTERPAHDERAFGAGCVEHRDEVPDVLVVGVGGGIQRAVRAAVAAAVHRDHVGMTGEVGDLPLPDPRVRDRPAVQKKRVGSPCPYSSQKTRTPSRSTYPVRSGYRARVCSCAVSVVVISTSPAILSRLDAEVAADLVAVGARGLARVELAAQPLVVAGLQSLPERGEDVEGPPPPSRSGGSPPSAA